MASNLTNPKTKKVGNNESGTRVQMDLHPGSMSRLRALKKMNDARSYADVMKDALRLYEFFLLEDQKGTKFYTKEHDGELVQIKLFI